MLRKNIKMMSKYTFQSRLLSYEIGPALYLGLLLGCTVLCAAACRIIHPERFVYLPLKEKQNYKKFHIILCCRRATFPSVRQDEEHINKSRTSSYKMAAFVMV